jgi:hypothetical protein
MPGKIVPKVSLFFCTDLESWLVVAEEPRLISFRKARQKSQKFSFSSTHTDLES